MQSVPTATPIPLRTDDAAILDNFDRRLHRLEQQVSGSLSGRVSYVEEGNFPDGIIIGGDPIGMIPPNAVTGVTATPGTFFENIFCDVEWDEAATGPDAVSFDVDLAEKLAGPTYSILNVFNTAGTNIRLNNLKPNKNYGVRVLPVNNLGVRGATPAWVDFTTGADNTIPPAPTGLGLARGATTVVVRFDGLTEAQAPDVAWGHGNYEIQIDTVNTFNSGNLRSMISSATVVAFSDIIGELPSWYARVRAIDSSGNASAWSAIFGPSGPMGGTVDSMIVAGLDAAKITFGTMSGDRITVNTLDAGRIKTSSLTAAEITLNGGAFKAGNPPTTGVLINSQGLRVYQGGSATVILDSVTGNATFSGTIVTANMVGGSITGGTITGAVIQTSASGQRIIMNSITDSLQFFSGSGTETFHGEIYTDVDPTVGPYMIVRGPKQASGNDSQLMLWGHSPAFPTAEIHLDTQAVRFTNIPFAYPYMYFDEHGFSLLGMGAGEFKFAVGGDSFAKYLLLGELPSGMVFYVEEGAPSRMYLGNGNASDWWSLKTVGSTGRVGTDFGYYVDFSGETPASTGRDHLHSAFRARGNSDSQYVNALGVEKSGGTFSGVLALAGNDGNPTRFVTGGGGGTGYIEIWVQDIAIASSSDFKQNIRDLNIRTGETIDALRPRSFEFRPAKRTSPGADQDGALTEPVQERIGFIAEEMHEVFPEAVKSGSGKHEAISYITVVTLLVAEVQELRNRVAQLEAA
jgi:hypothetical protein